MDYIQQSAVPRSERGATHGGEDVMILAQGPMSHLFHKVHQQSYIAHVIRYNKTNHGFNERNLVQ